jgi:acylphosphatase
MEEGRKHLNITIRGRVQGVAFRYSAQHAASSIGIMGFARNLPDGRVYLEVEGSQEQVQEFLAWCWKGPPMADVIEVTTFEGTWQGYDDFDIYH